MSFNSLKTLFATIVTTSIAVGISPATTVHAEFSNPALEAVETLIAENPVLAEIQQADNAAEQAWMNDLLCSLLQSDQPLTRIRASTAIDRLNGLVEAAQGEELIACPGLTPRTTATVRHAALEDGWNDPAVVFHVLLAGCDDPSGGTGCDERRIIERLSVIDSDNSAVHLLSLWNSVKNWKLLQFEWTPSEEEWLRGREALLTSLNADSFALYQTAGVFDAYLEISSNAIGNPPPQASEAIKAVYRDAGIDRKRPEDPAWTGSSVLSIGNMDILGWRPWQGIWVGLCARAATEQDETAIGACEHLADVLVASPQAPIWLNPGLAIQQVLKNPSTAEEGGLTSSLQYSIRQMVYICEVPKQASFPVPSSTLPQNHYALFQEDWQNLGERDAIRQAAIREYAVDPTPFAVDPARCRDALELDEATQLAIVQAFRPEGQNRSSIEDGMAAMAEALNK